MNRDPVTSHQKCHHQGVDYSSRATGQSVTVVTCAQPHFNSPPQFSSPLTTYLTSPTTRTTRFTSPTTQTVVSPSSTPAATYRMQQPAHYPGQNQLPQGAPPTNTILETLSRQMAEMQRTLQSVYQEQQNLRQHISNEIQQLRGEMTMMIDRKCTEINNRVDIETSQLHHRIDEVKEQLASVEESVQPPEFEVSRTVIARKVPAKPNENMTQIARQIIYDGTKSTGVEIDRCGNFKNSTSGKSLQ